MITHEEAASHRLRNVLTNVLGGNVRLVDVEIHRVGLANGDRLLLCTDGLHGVVKNGEVAAALSRMEQPDKTCRELVDLALERGAPDNVTAVAARYTV
jgi:protein phosphatase